MAARPLGVASAPASLKSSGQSVFRPWELPPFSHDLKDARGQPLKASMYRLAGLDPEDDGRTDLDRLVGAYRDWIASLEPVNSRSPHIPESLHETARVVVDRSRHCLDRIEAGPRLSSLSEPTRRPSQAGLSARKRGHADLTTSLKPRGENSEDR